MLVRNKKKPRTKRAVNPLRVDPTRTGSLRRTFTVKIRQKFRRLAYEITKLVVEEDVFGLREIKHTIASLTTPPKMRVLPRSITNGWVAIGNAFCPKPLTTNDRWRFFPTPDKIRAFQDWLAQQYQQHLIGQSDEQLWQQYIETGFRRGAGRSFDDVRQQELRRRRPDLFTPAAQGALRDFYAGSKEEFLRSAFGQPVAAETLKLLAGRSFDDLKNVTVDMSTKISRALADGLVQGKGPRDVARDLTGVVDISLERAELIARTECLPGDTLVDAAVVRAVFRRWYVGPMVEVKTRNGRKFSATPNHPMLTLDGWKAAGAIQGGDNLVCHDGQEHLRSPRNQHVQRPPSTLSQIFDSLNTVRVAERVRTSKPDFHGDGLEGEVDILRPDRELRIGNFSPLAKPLVEQIFSPSGQAASAFCRFCTRLLPINQRACGCNAARRDATLFQATRNETTIGTKIGSDGFHRFSSYIPFNNLSVVNVGTVVVIDPSFSPGLELGFRVGASDALLAQDLTNLLLLGTNGSSDLPLCEAGQVELDDVLSVSIRPFAGHVYNLETPVGYYTIDGMYTGNTIRAYAEGQLVALKNLGVEEVGVLVEFLTTPDRKLCPRCRSMKGVVFKIDEAHGKIPVHPRCRCAWTVSLKAI